MHVTPIAMVTLAGPDGPLIVAATQRGVVAVAWLSTEDAFLADLRRRLGPIEVTSGGPARDHLHAAIPVIEAAFAGHRTDANRIAFDLDDRPAFDRRVLRVVRRLAWGETASYSEIARQIGAPRAARAVGGALGRNPIALVIPCHRVIAADGTLGGYGGPEGDRDAHLDRKQSLLLREGVIVARRGG